MKRMSILTMAAVGAAVFAMVVPHAALAAGTAANTSVDNTAVLSWNAGAVAYTTSDSATFVVDRLVTFTVTNQTAGGLTVDVLPGITGAEPDVNVLAFGVTNASNTTLDFVLSALNTGDGVTSNVSIYVDNGDGIFDTATDIIAATLDNVPADSTGYVFVVGDIASTAVTPEVQNVDLLAEAVDYATGTSLLSDSGTAWQATTVQNVLFDTAGTAAGDAANDGFASDRGFYQVVMPDLAVSKTISAVTDTRAFNSTNPKAIPGAYVRYVITIDNTGTADATGVTVVDVIPAGTDYVIDSLAISGVADTDDTAAPGDYNVTNAGAVTAPLAADLAAGNSTTVGFTVQVTP